MPICITPYDAYYLIPLMAIKQLPAGLNYILFGGKLTGRLNFVPGARYAWAIVTNSYFIPRAEGSFNPRSTEGARGIGLSGWGSNLRDSPLFGCIRERDLWRGYLLRPIPIRTSRGTYDKGLPRYCLLCSGWEPHSRGSGGRTSSPGWENYHRRL